MSVKCVIKFENAVNGLQANKDYFAVGSNGTTTVYDDKMSPIIVDLTKITKQVGDESQRTEPAYELVWTENVSSGGRSKSRRNRRNRRNQSKSRRN